MRPISPSRGGSKGGGNNADQIKANQYNYCKYLPLPSPEGDIAWRLKIIKKNSTR